MYESMDNHDKAKLSRLLNPYEAAIEIGDLEYDLIEFINELLEHCAKSAYDSGHTDGKDEGHDEGYDEGYAEGYDEGVDDTESRFDEYE